MEKISAVYKIINTVTKDSYIGSSKDVMRRWRHHKCPSKWKEHPNSSLYQDMQKYGIENFTFQILAPVMPEYLKQVEQELIDMLHPSYNSNRANGWDLERQKEWKQSNKEHYKEYQKEHRHQLCSYNGETLTLHTLSMRFRRAGIPHATIEAKKYLLNQQ